MATRFEHPTMSTDVQRRRQHELDRAAEHRRRVEESLRGPALSRLARALASAVGTLGSAGRPTASEPEARLSREIPA